MADRKTRIRQLALDLGFQGIGFAPVALGEAEARYMAWLERGYHGAMDYMARHGAKRTRPTVLVPGTRSIISVRLDYFPQGEPPLQPGSPEYADISRYARGRDYHKVLRHGLQKLADAMTAEFGPFSYRAFTDSAPVMEVELARLAGLGWRGKHTLLLSRTGSWFFLGELYTDLDLASDPPETGHCGQCRACLDICPTQAFVAPYVLDARRCISYLTIEHPGSIPEELRPLMGNRIYGCDDCQAVCPWNRFAQGPGHPDFTPRNGLEQARLVDLFAWSEAEFMQRLAGSPIRRIGHERWLRNIAVALGNGPATAASLAALEQRRGDASPLVREHVDWALSRLAEGPAKPPA